MSLTPQSRHDAIINYLKEINKTTKVFESNTKWKKGTLLNSKILHATPVSTYKKYGWTQTQIETLFARARSSITHKPNPIIKNKPKSIRNKNKLKRNTDGNHQSDSKTQGKQTRKTAQSTSINTHKTRDSTEANPYLDGSNPYLDASVLSMDDKVNKKPRAFDVDDDHHENLSPLSAKQILEQIPWEKMKDYGMTMECNLVFRRDNDSLMDKLKADNTHLMERIKCLEKRLQKQNEKCDVDSKLEMRCNFDGLNDGLVILKSVYNNKVLIAKHGILMTSKEFIGFEVFTLWRMTKSEHNTYIFQMDDAVERSNFIRILGNDGSSSDVDIKGNGSCDCEFKVHLVLNRNTVMLESAMFPNKYLAVNKDGNAYVHQSDVIMQQNEECMFQVLMQQNEIILNIKKPDGQMIIVHIDINDNVWSLKRIIQEKEMILIKEQLLYFEEMELDNNNSLKKYNIKHNDVIHLKLAIEHDIKEDKHDIKQDKEHDIKEEHELNDTISSSDEYNETSEDDVSSASSTESQHEHAEDKEHNDDNEIDDDDIKQIEVTETPSKLTQQTSVFKCTVDETDGHNGGISSICVSPVDYKVVTGGEHDSSLRIWQPKRIQKEDGKLLSEIQFIPLQKAHVDGTVFSVNMSDDGVLIAAGCSWRKSQNGYVVIWNMKKNGNILCDLKSKDNMRRTRHSRSLSVGVESLNTKKISKSNIFKIKQTDSISSLRFGVVHCVKFMKFESKKKHRLNYLLFGGDTTGCVLCWNLSLKQNKEIPICRINAGNDIIYDLEIKQNKYLFAVSHDKTMRYCNIKGFKKKAPLIDEDRFERIQTMQIYKDQEYPLHSIAFNEECNELIFGSRKCMQFEMNQIVVIQHKYNKYLCLNDKRQLTGNGVEMTHKSIKWNIEYLPKDRIRLRSRKSGKYLRIRSNGTVDVDGDGQQNEFESILIWKVNDKTLQSHKYPEYFVSVNKENNAVICVTKKNINDKISIEFDLFDADKLNTFESFFKSIYEPPQDLDRIKHLKIRNKLLIVQRKGINQVKLFSLNKSNGDKLLKQYKIAECQCYDDDMDDIEIDMNQHIFRIYDSGISFNNKYLILCVGIFGTNNLKKAVAFSLRGIKIVKSSKKTSKLYSFCPN